MSENVVRLSIGGMSCAGCVAAVENALRSVDGVEEATVNLGERTARVEGEVESEALVEAVKTAGYDAAELKSLADEVEKEAIELVHYRKLLRQFWVAAAVGVPLMIVSMSPLMPPSKVPVESSGSWRG